MAELLADKIINKIKQAAELYYRLVLVVASSGSGKTKSLQVTKNLINAPLINTNLELSKEMLDLTKRQRAIKISQLLRDIVNELGAEAVLLDNIEILFDVSLEQDPLRLLQGLSRDKTIVAAWNGAIDSNYLIYAEPNHPEHRRYPTDDLLVVSPE